MSPPIVWSRSAVTVSIVILRDSSWSTSFDCMKPILEAHRSSKGGTKFRFSRNCFQWTINSAKMGGPRRQTAAFSARTPNERSIIPMPALCKRMLTVEPAAMPTSAQGPH
eukprot:scaffold190032_cov35-Tisochrysis_lutea.AAC.2